MNAKVFVSLLLSLSIRAPRYSLQSTPWKARLESFAFSAFLHVWRFYKFAHRAITGQGAIERLCQSVRGTESLEVDGRRVDLENSEVRSIVWRIGTCIASSTSDVDAEFRLSAVLVEEYATMNYIAREQANEETDLSKMDVREVAGDIALGVQQRKQMYFPISAR
jgi:hypothetical protein